MDAGSDAIGIGILDVLKKHNVKATFFLQAAGQISIQVTQKEWLLKGTILETLRTPIQMQLKQIQIFLSRISLKLRKQY